MENLMLRDFFRAGVWILALIMFMLHCIAVIRWKDEEVAYNTFRIVLLLLALVTSAKYVFG